MKLVMDEKLKHRLIGLAVIISLAAIFAPAVMRKSNQRAEDNFSVNVQLPAKPTSPEVAMTDEKEMFKTIKISRAELSPVSDEDQLPELAKAEPLKAEPAQTPPESEIAEIAPEIQAQEIRLAVEEATKSKAQKVIQVAANNAVKSAAYATLNKKKPVQVAKTTKSVKPAKAIRVAKAAPVRAKQPVQKDVYAVQLASFAQLSNAQALVSRLRNKGYKANFIRIKGRQGPVYKVYAGHSPRKNDALRIKTQLASAMQLNGFVVNTGVS